jgi:hypothetical protein
METRKLTFFVLIFVICLFIARPHFADAYNAQITHRSLTIKVVALYNLYHPEDTISPENVNSIIEGSKAEDSGCEDDDSFLEYKRCFNHFFDPIRGKGFKGEGTSAKEWAAHQRFGSFMKQTEESLVQTIMNPLVYVLGGTPAQEKCTFAENDYSWERAVCEKRTTVGFESLGHTLHLIEDMSVPAHTRDDSHSDKFFDGNDPYENWSKFALPEDTFSKEKVSTCENLEKCFDELAGSTNGNFFSNGTINKEYKSPELKTVKVRRFSDGRYYAYSVLEGKEVYLFRADYWFGLRFPKIEESDYFLMDSQWKHLSSKAVLTGVRIVELYMEETKPKKGFIGTITDKIASTTEAVKNKVTDTVDTVKNLPETATEKANEAVEQKSKEVSVAIEKKTEEAMDNFVKELEKAIEREMRRQCTAEAAYASSENEDLTTLREFRDNTLNKNDAGRLLIKEYYQNSPPVAEYLSEHETARVIIKNGFFVPLAEIIRLLKN